MLCPIGERNGNPEVPRHGKLLQILNQEIISSGRAPVRCHACDCILTIYLRKTVVPLSTSLKSKSIGKTPTN